MTTSCKQCSLEFKTYQSRLVAGHDRHCSKECLKKSREENKLKRDCLVCGNTFNTKPARVKDGRGKFCSQPCYATSKIGTVGYWKGSKRSTPWMIGHANHRWAGGYTGRHAVSKEIGGKHTKTQWEALKNQFGYMCLCCKKHEPEVTLTKDHVVPITLWKEWVSKNKPSYQGNDIQNIQPLCQSCNSRKNNNNCNDFRNMEYNGTDWATLMTVAQ